MKTLAAPAFLLGLVACGNLNPSAMAQAAGAGALKQIQEGKGFTAEGMAKLAAESAGVPTDAEGLAKAAGLPAVPGLNGGGGATSAASLLSGSKGNALGDTTNAIATANSLVTMASAPRAASNTGAKAPPTNGPSAFASESPAGRSPSAVAPMTPAPASHAAVQPIGSSPTTTADDVSGANFRIEKLKVDEVRLGAITCRLAPGSDVSGLFGPAVIGAGFRERQSRLDACSRNVIDTRVTWVATNSKTVKVRASGDDPKINACVERALVGSVAMVDGTCGATLTHGKSK